MEPAPRGGGAEGEERFPNLGKTPLRQGNRLGQKGSIWGFWKKKWPICGRQDRVKTTQTVHTAALRAQTGTCVHRCARGLGAGAWGMKNRPGAITAVGCGEMEWGDRREEICSRECLWRKTGLPRKQGAIAESQAEGRATIVASLSPHAGACWRQ